MNTLEEEGRSDKKVVLCSLGALLIAGAGVGAWKYGAPSSTAEAPSVDEPGSPPVTTTESELSEQRLPLERFLMGTAEGLDRLDDLEECEGRWRAEILPLLTNEAGRRLAADEASVAAMAEILARPRASAERIASYRSELAFLSNPVRADVRDGPPFQPPSKARCDAQWDLRGNVFRELEAYWNDLQFVSDLVAASSKVPPGENELKEAISELRIAAAKEKAQAMLELRAEEASAEREAELEESRLLTLAQSPETRRLYSAFLAAGHYECRNGAKLPGPPGPVSLANLRYWNVIGDVARFAGFACVRDVPFKKPGHGLQWLLFSGNDRPGVADFPETEAQWAEWEERRKQFAELTPVFLDLGLLRP